MRTGRRSRRGPVYLVLPALLLASCTAAPPPPADPAYVDGIEQWRAGREDRLRSPGGWLTLVGLYWLEPGENTFGSGDDNHLVLPAGRGPERAGAFVLGDSGVTLDAPDGSAVTVGGEPFSGRRVLAPDVTSSPDIVEVDDLKLHVILRADRYGVRVKDPRSPVLAAFEGLDYYPIDTAYRVDARWLPYDEPKEHELATAVGTVQKMVVPGRAEFELGGESVSLEPMLGSLEDESWFFLMRDKTSGKETYGAGRYLYTDPPKDGRIVLDFNKAYNPPCVFTPYATCPLPPRQNWLEVAIEAGEKDFGEH